MLAVKNINQRVSLLEAIQVALNEIACKKAALPVLQANDPLCSASPLNPGEAPLFNKLKILVIQDSQKEEIRENRQFVSSQI
jgi:hypothetical protein